MEKIEINGKTYVLESKKVNNSDGLTYVMVRTYSAGVHCGYLESREGKEVVLLEAIRIWQWSGAASLSQLSQEGTKNPENCKFSIPLKTKLMLTEAIEVIEMTEEAVNNIKAVESWKK